MRPLLLLALAGCSRSNITLEAEGKLPVSLCAATRIFDGQPKTGEVVQFEGIPWQIHRDDCLVLAHPHVVWLENKAKAGLELGKSDELPKRSNRVKIDALFVGTELFSILPYLDEHEDVLWVEGERTNLAPVFTKLTGVQPPPRD